MKQQLKYSIDPIIDKELEKARNRKKKKKETYVKGVGLVEEVISLKQINEELLKIKDMNNEDQEKSLEELYKQSGKRVKKIKEKLKKLSRNQKTLHPTWQ